MYKKKKTCCKLQGDAINHATLLINDEQTKGNLLQPLKHLSATLDIKDLLHQELKTTCL